MLFYLGGSKESTTPVKAQMQLSMENYCRNIHPCLLVLWDHLKYKEWLFVKVLTIIT